VASTYGTVADGTIPNGAGVSWTVPGGQSFIEGSLTLYNPNALQQVVEFHVQRSGGSDRQLGLFTLAATGGSVVYGLPQLSTGDKITLIADTTNNVVNFLIAGELIS